LESETILKRLIENMWVGKDKERREPLSFLSNERAVVSGINGVGGEEGEKEGTGQLHMWPIE
jgi:hypothetical protein